MTNSDFDRKMAALKDLIAAEKEAALSQFEQLDCVSSMEDLVKSRRKRARPLLLALQRPPVWGLSLAMAAILLVVLYAIRSPSPYEESIQALGEILNNASQNPLLSATLDEKEREVSPGEMAFYQFEWSLQRILFEVQREELPDENVPFLLHEILQTFEWDLKPGLPLYSEPETLFPELEKDLRTLREAKNFQSLFSLTLKKLKEV